MQTFTVGSFIRAGWELFKIRPWFLIGACVLFGLVYGVVMFLMGVVAAVTLAALGENVAAQIFVSVAQFLLGSLMWVSLFAFFLKAHSNINEITFGDLWKPRNFWNYVGTSILLMIIILVGFVLLIIPGLIASMMFMFAPYIAIDKGLSPIAALKESARITKGNRWRLFALSTAVMLLILLGYIALLVGALVAMPVVVFAGIDAYRKMTAHADSGAARVPLTGGEKVLAGLFLLFPVLGIVSSIVLASLGSAREKAMEAREQAQLATLQYALELTYDTQGSYPQTLEEVISQNDGALAGMLREVSIDDFAYVVGADGATYGLCAPPLPDGTDRCVSSLPPENTTSDESADMVR